MVLKMRTIKTYNPDFPRTGTNYKEELRRTAFRTDQFQWQEHRYCRTCMLPDSSVREKLQGYAYLAFGL